MTQARVLEQLAEFQARFSAVLRTPLDDTTGTFVPNPALYSDAAVAPIKPGRAGSAQAQLAIYNRQYWLRLFSALQTELPLSARALGYFEFNGHASSFLGEHAPRHFDLGRAADGFAEYLEQKLLGTGTAPVIEAVRLDEAWRAIWRAPDTPPLVLSQEHRALIPTKRLIANPALRIVRETRAWLKLRGRLGEMPGEAPLALPALHAEPRYHALLRRGLVTAQVPLEPAEARLFELLAAHPLAEALTRLQEERQPATEHAATNELAAKVQEWLGRAQALGFFTALG